MTAGEYSFAGLNLNDGTAYKVSGPGQIVAATPDVLRQALARREGSIKVQRRYAEKMLRLSGRVLGATKAAKESNFDALVLTLGYGEQILKNGWEDERYFLGELMTLNPLRQHGTLDLPFEADFLLADPFAYAPSTSIESDTNALTQVSGNHRSKSFNVTVGGTAFAHPGITLTITNLGTATSAIWVVCADLPGTPTLTITRTFALNDVIVIDPREQSVKVNGAEVDYTGTFPWLDPRVAADNTLEIHSTSTANPTIEADVDWIPRYMAA